MADARFDPSFVEDLGNSYGIITSIIETLGKKVVGQKLLRKRLVECLLVDGHILLEGVPGLAKTLSIRALADAIHASFQRIQFTPDLLPADIIGTEVFRPKDGTFEVRKGPIFANFVLADEINRSPAKVQSALLETMQEYQVTIGNQSFAIPRPFFVLATQNPIEQEGTYPLPEAQIDRFTVKVKVDYPSVEEEQEILQLVTSRRYQQSLQAVASLEDISEAAELVHKIYVDVRIRDYIVDIVAATRDPKRYNLDLAPLIELGASPRASIALYKMAQAEAMLSEEHFVVPQNVKDVAHDVLRHRIIPSYEAEARGLTSDDLINSILEGVQVP